MIFDLRLGKASYHLYFMILIIQFYILFPILIKVYQTINKPFAVLAGTIIIRLVLNPYITIAYKDRFFFSYMTFYILGFVVADLKIKGHKVSSLTSNALYGLHILITAFYLAEGIRVILGYQRLISNSYKYDSFLYIHSGIIILYLSAHLYKRVIQSERIKSYMATMGQISFTIYLVHRLIMSIWHELPIYPVIKSLSMSLAFVLEIIVTVVLSIVVSIILKKVGYTFRNRTRSTVT